MRPRASVALLLLLAAALASGAAQAQAPLDPYNLHAGGPGGLVVLDGNGLIPPALLPPAGTGGGIAPVNRPLIAPITDMVGTAAVQVFPPAQYVAVIIENITPGGILACTGDGTAPVLGTTPGALYGQTLFWPDHLGGPAPTGAVRCVASITTSILTEAH